MDMKPVSGTRLTVITLVLAGAGLRPQAGPVTPDPAGCFFTPISAQVSTGKTPQNRSVLALSGDGQTALLRSRFTSFDEPMITIDEEFFFRNNTRTLLTHFDSSQHIGGPVIHTSGPSWNSVDLPFDGSFVATTKSEGGGIQAQLLSLPGLNASALSLTRVFKVSGNGAWIVGRDSEGQLVRLRREDGHTDVLDQGPNAASDAVLGVSYDGDTVCGYHSLLGLRPVFRWTAAGGMRELATPEGFIPDSVDASGEIFVGRLILPQQTVPACWSEREGLVQLTTSLNGSDVGYGFATLISGNGQLIFGSLNVPVAWTRDGSIHEISSLIRGVDLGGAVISSVDAVSHDGRTIAGRCHTQGPTTSLFFLAGLALPGEGPRIVLQPTAAGGRTLHFHAKAGFHYQVQGSTSLGDWTAAALPEFTGDDADHAVALPTGSEVASFFRLVVTP